MSLGIMDALRRWTGRQKDAPPKFEDSHNVAPAIVDEPKKLYGDPRYKRTQGYRNRVNKMCWAPVIRDTVAWLKSGRRYEMRTDGWRRLKSA